LARQVLFYVEFIALFLLTNRVHTYQKVHFFPTRTDLAVELLKDQTPLSQKQPGGGGVAIAPFCLLIQAIKIFPLARLMVYLYLFFSKKEIVQK
jgi:hypothetical protein